MIPTETAEIRMIPISRIEVINPRVRNQKQFRKVVNSIDRVGLKKPITVAIKPDSDPQAYYLACGQGRMEAFIELEQTEIPAVILSATKEECMVISLVENMARRQQRPFELFSAIKALKDRGYSDEEIGTKIDMPAKKISGILKLLNHGEEGLIRAVMHEEIPITVATTIASVPEKEAQTALQEAFQSEGLRGQDLRKAKRIAERRLRYGPKMKSPSRKKEPGEKLTGKTLARTIQQESDRRQSLVRKADLYRNIILFVSSATKKLIADPNYVNLLRAVGITDMPSLLESRIHQLGKAHE
ncbi:MAG: ParB N-terminal domain-containing protein [Magnetococcales bacterium]|nr:ParB N-terminal domain-containing protein [Magnetococcales bacterium]